MKYTDDYLIAAYLRNELTAPEEELEFNNRLEQNSEFQKKLDFEEALFHAFQDDVWLETKDPTSHEVLTYKKWFEDESIVTWKQTLSTSMEATPVIRLKTRRTWYTVAAMVLLLLVPLYFLLNKAQNPEELYANYADYSDLPTLVVRSDTHESDIGILAQQQFESGDFVKSTETLKLAMTQESNPDAILYIYLGIAQLELDQFTDAKATFLQLQELDALESERAYWYLALLHTKQGLYEEATSDLNKIIEKKYFGYQDAISLLKELQSKQ